MRRRIAALVLVSLTSAALSAATLHFGPASRVAPSRLGTPGSDFAVRVEPRVNGFAAYWQHGNDLWVKDVPGFPARPDDGSSRRIGTAYVVETPSGAMALFTRDDTNYVARADAIDSPSATTVGAGYAIAFACNATHCAAVLRTEDGNAIRIAIVSGSTVRFIERPGRIDATLTSDPTGFLAIETVPGARPRALRFDNDGNITADVQLPFPAVQMATAFNGSSYAIFTNAGQTVVGVLLTLDGRLSNLRTAVNSSFAPLSAAWNGSEYLLILETIFGGIPEYPPPVRIFGALADPALSPLSPSPFPISEATGWNSPSNVAWNGHLFYVTWTHRTGSYLTYPPEATAVEGSSITQLGEVLTRDLVSRGAVAQSNPAVAQGKSTSLTAWLESDFQFETTTLKFALLGRNGLTRIASGDLGTSGFAFPVEVTALGDDYLVLWRTGGGAIVRGNGAIEPLSLPVFNPGHAAASRDRWLVVGTTPAGPRSVVILRDGTAAASVALPPELGEITGLASDGKRFFAATYGGALLDENGTLVVLRPTRETLLSVDFAGNVYAAATDGGVIERFDTDGNRLGLTAVASRTYWSPALSHIGSNFIATEDADGTKRISVMAPDGTLLAREQPIPDVVIARTDESTSTAVETRSVTVAPEYPAADALFAESVSLVPAPRTRAVRR